ncbi:hypothetical protein HRbin23_01419 [bacterium HR23]|nr:hypothetical protein HRbin23_01419 [bacterium HR23]
MQRAVALALVGGIGWGFHWLALARVDTGSVLRQVYLYLFAFLGGAVTTLVVSALVLFAVLAWALGLPTVPTAQHFRIVPQVLPALLVGSALLAYHWRVVQGESARREGHLEGARRAFGYILAGLGLATLVAGLVSLLGLLLGFAVPGMGTPLVGMEPWRGLLALALTQVAIGGPLWAWHWGRAQGRAVREGEAERTTLARRIFLYAVLCLLALVGLGGAVGFLSLLLRDLLAGRLSAEFLGVGRWPLAVVLTTLAFLPYYWQVLREDQRAGAEGVGRRKAIILVVGERGTALRSQLEEALGVSVHTLWVEDAEEPPHLTPEALDALREQVRSIPGQRVLIVALRGVVQVYGCR